MTLYYIRPYCRMGPYICGVLTGYFLYKTKGKCRINIVSIICFMSLISSVCNKKVYAYSMYTKSCLRAHWYHFSTWICWDGWSLQVAHAESSTVFLMPSVVDTVWMLMNPRFTMPCTEVSGEQQYVRSSSHAQLGMQVPFWLFSNFKFPAIC